MPTFSAIALENLLEPRVRDSCKKPLNLNPVTGTLNKAEEGETEAVSKPPPAPRHIYISPALYTTPEPAPIPEYLSEPLSPSPYVVNHKRRGGGVRAVGNRRSNGFEFVDGEKNKESGIDELKVVAEENFGDSNLFEDGENANMDEEDGFLDSNCESASVECENETRQFDCRSFESAQGEFFDAIEDFSSDNSVINTPSYGTSVESELHAIRLRLLKEIEGRRNAEEALNLMQSHWQRLSNLLSGAGLTFPTSSNASGILSCENASIEELSQEVIITRFVAEAIGKGQARAEAELAAELILQSKDQEISRLRDRLQYYEAMNHEMSQRNLEIVEVARKQRQRRKSRRRWFWSCIGLSIAVGISIVGYSYLPGTSKHQDLSSSSDVSDASHVSPAEAA